MGKSNSSASTVLHIDMNANLLDYLFFKQSLDWNGPKGPFLVDHDHDGCFCEYAVEP